jgi:hypothetical protein
MLQAAFFVGLRLALVATQLCGKHLSAAVNQYATVEEAVFSVRPPGGCITRISLRQLKLETFRVGCSSRELKESAVDSD